MTIKLPDKPRKHRFVTEAIDEGQTFVTVWPSEDDLKTPAKRQSFLGTIMKVGNDPRITKVEKYLHDVNGVDEVVYLFHISDA